MRKTTVKMLMMEYITKNYYLYKIQNIQNKYFIKLCIQLQSIY